MGRERREASIADAAINEKRTLSQLWGHKGKSKTRQRAEEDTIGRERREASVADSSVRERRPLSQLWGQNGKIKPRQRAEEKITARQRRYIDDEADYAYDEGQKEDIWRNEDEKL